MTHCSNDPPLLIMRENASITPRDPNQKLNCHLCNEKTVLECAKGQDLHFGRKHNGEVVIGNESPVQFSCLKWKQNSDSSWKCEKPHSSKTHVKHEGTWEQKLHTEHGALALSDKINAMRKQQQHQSFSKQYGFDV